MTRQLETDLNYKGLIEKSLNQLSTLYSINKTNYEVKVIRINKFILSYFADKICEGTKNSYRIMVFLTEWDTICIGNANFPEKELSINNLNSSAELKRAFLEVINLLDSDKNFIIIETNGYPNASKAYSITFRPKKS